MDQFLSLLYHMIGFVKSNGEPVGGAKFLRLQNRGPKSHVKMIGSSLKDFTWSSFNLYEQNSKAWKSS